MPEPTHGLEHGLTNYGDRDFSLYLRRSFAQSMGYSRAMLGKPVVGIAYTPSGFNNCHRHFPELLDAVKRGVLAAGALPIDFPTISLGEVFLSPTSLKYRNLMSIDTEEMIRAQPMDAVVLMGGCDKTVPAQLMGAVSAGRPAVMLVAGPMMTGRHRGERLGACTDCRRFWARYRAGEVDDAEISQVEGQLAVTAGTCAVMGTASTMACLAEALGLILPGTAAIPAVHADRLRAAEATGAAAVRLIGSDRTPDRIVNAKSMENALRVLLALGGSTNAVIHLTAIAGRAGVKVSLEQINRLSDSTPVLVNLKPVGNGYMEDFFASGGMGALLRELAPLLHLDCMTVTGETLGERLAGRCRPPCRPLDHRRARAAVRAARRARRPVRQSRAEGRHPQALGGRRQAVRARGQGGGVLLARRSRRAHGRSGARRHPAGRAGAAECRAPRARMHAGGRLSADPAEARPKRRQGHDPRLRRAHERHRLRHHRASRHAGRGLRRSARPRPQRRPYPPLGQGTARRSPGRGGRAQAARRRHQARAVQPARGYARLYAQEILGADEGCDFGFLRPAAGR